MLAVNLGWHPAQALEFALVGQNLLHAHHPEYNAAGPAQEQIQRTGYGKLAVRF